MAALRLVNACVPLTTDSGAPQARPWSLQSCAVYQLASASGVNDTVIDVGVVAKDSDGVARVTRVGIPVEEPTAESTYDTPSPIAVSLTV